MDSEGSRDGSGDGLVAVRMRRNWAIGCAIRERIYDSLEGKREADSADCMDTADVSDWYPSDMTEPPRTWLRSGLLGYGGRYEDR